MGHLVLVGGTIVLVYGWGRKLQLGQAIAPAMLSLVMMGGAMFVLAFEGLMCPIMAFLLAALGGALSYIIHPSMQARSHTQLMAIWVWVLPLLVSLEGAGTRQLPLQLPPQLPLQLPLQVVVRVEVTVVEIDAPPADSVAAHPPLQHPSNPPLGIAPHVA